MKIFRRYELGLDTGGSKEERGVKDDSQFSTLGG